MQEESYVNIFPDNYRLLVSTILMSTNAPQVNTTLDDPLNRKSKLPVETCAINNARPSIIDK